MSGRATTLLLSGTALAGLALAYGVYETVVKALDLL